MPRAQRLMLGLLLAPLAACRGDTSTPVAPALLPAPEGDVAPPPSPPLVAAARAQVGVVRIYDPTYFGIPYPGGDVPADRGVCTDVVIRALRTQGLDLQQAIHEDMLTHFDLYPDRWGLSRPDRSIDHRRVPNQMRWFERHGWIRPTGRSAGDFAPGDIVAWALTGSGQLHIGIVSDRRSHDGTPLILHNISAGTQEDDLLFRHAIIGHYRQPVALSRS